MKVAINRCSGREHQKTVPVRGKTLLKNLELEAVSGLGCLKSFNSPPGLIYSFGFHKSLESPSERQVNKYYLLLTGRRKCVI